MKNNKVTVGQKVYLFDGQELAVTKVDKNYFYTKGDAYIERKFDLEKLVEVKDCKFYERVFLSKEHLDNHKLRNLLSNTLYKQFGTCGYYDNLTLDQLQRIANILKEEN